MNLGNDFVGRVIYNEDPTFSGRCKVKVFGLFDDLPDENVPWFVPANSNIFGTEGGGSLSVPKVGDIVRVRFSNSDYYSGEYTGLQCIDPNLVNEIKDDYQDSQVILYDAANEVTIIYQRMTGLKLYHRGATIVIDPTGNIQLKHQNNANVIEINDNDINIVSGSTDENNSATGTINISSGSVVNINSTTANINADHVNIGNSPSQPAVLGRKLTFALQQIVNELAQKTPQGSTLIANTFEDILSNNVKISQ